MRSPIYQIDAFTSRVFAGNPAAVMTMKHFPSDAFMLAIAAGNNLSETAFLGSKVRSPNGKPLDRVQSPDAP